LVSSIVPIAIAWLLYLLLLWAKAKPCPLDAKLAELRAKPYCEYQMGEQLKAGSFKIACDGTSIGLFVCHDNSGFWLFVFDVDGHLMDDPTFTAYHDESYANPSGEPAPDFLERESR